MSEQSARIRMLYDTTTRWESANPILLKGEMGVEDKGGQGFAIKFGDGMTNWNLLPYTTLSPNEIKQLKSDLQAQIDSIVTSSTGTGDSAAEVAQSRITADGILFDTLKERLDGSDSSTKGLKEGAASYKYLSGYKSGFYDSTNNAVTYKNTNKTLACNKLPVRVPKGHMAVIDTKNFYVLPQFSGNGTVLSNAAVMVDGEQVGGYFKSDFMVFPAHDYDVDMYFRVGNDKEHTTEISPENVDISIKVCKPTANTIIQGNAFIFVADNQIHIETTSTFRCAVNGAFPVHQNKKFSFPKPTSGTFFICMNKEGFYLRNLTFLTSVDCPVAYYYTDKIFPLRDNGIICNSIPLTDWYQRENVPIFINNKKLNFDIDNRANSQFVDNFGYFYRVKNGFDYTSGNLFYYADKSGLKLTTDSVVKKNSTDISGKRILTVGDSVTRRGWYQQQIKNHVPTVEFLGTQTAYYNNIQCEGYSGLKAENVLKDATLKLTNGTTIANPFYNPATKKVDFAYYCTHNNISPDYVVIEFGLNETSSKNYNTYMRNFISQIKDYNSTIVVYVVQPFGESDGAAFNKKTANHRRAFAECVLESYKLADCVKIPCYFIMVDDYDYEPSQLDYGYGDLTVSGTSDGVHPKEQTGFAKLGDMIFNWLGESEN